MNVRIYTLGCKLNQCESEAIADAFVHQGFDLVTKDEAADIYIINTCTVTSKAEQKARRMARLYHNLNKEAAVIITGCYAQMERAMLEALSDRVIVVSLDDKPNLLTLPERLSKRLIADFDIVEAIRDSFSTQSEKSSSFDYDAASFSFHSRAFLKIQDGCDNECAYCRVTIARGDSRSLPSEEVLERSRALIESGYKEIVLTGVNISAYRDKDMRLEHLLRLLLDSLDTSVRIRLSSLEPDMFSPLFYEVLSDERIQPHFHLPLQSLSDTVLKRVNRHYTWEVVQEVVENLKRVKDSPFIAADIITGLPAEEEEDFRLTYERLQEINITQLHVFPFSPRPGTALEGAKDRVPEYKRDERAKRLRDLSNVHYRRYMKDQIGKKVEVLVEKVKDGKLTGITGNYLKVEILQAPPEVVSGTVIEAKLAENIRTAASPSAVFTKVLYA